MYFLAYKLDNFIPVQKRSEINIEIIRFIINGIILSGAGLIFYGIKSNSDQFHEEQKQKSFFLKSVIESYNRVKSIRRRIRFANTSNESDEFIFDGRVIDNLLLELNEAQLSLETSKRIARANPRYLRPHAAKVDDRLAIMENFLNEVVQSSIGQFHNVTVQKSDGGPLYEFIGRNSGKRGSRCEEELFSQMDEMIAELS